MFGCNQQIIKKDTHTDALTRTLQILDGIGVDVNSVRKKEKQQPIIGSEVIVMYGGGLGNGRIVGM